MSTRSQLLDSIDHTGTVMSVDAAHGVAYVSIDEQTECGACPAARLCGTGKTADGKEKSKVAVAVSRSQCGRLRPGMKVTVSGTEQMHRRAIMLATVFPCLALVAVMVGVYILTGSQGWAAMCGLAAMCIFFLLLYLGRNRVAHEFRFRITAIHAEK